MSEKVPEKSPEKLPEEPPQHGTGGRFRLSADVIATDTDDGMVLLDGRTGRYWQFNSTAAAVLRALRAGDGVDQVADGLVGRYRIDPARARADVQDLTDRLRAAGLVAP